MKPLIFDIRGFSIDDGPGIRTTVFLKGCLMSCVWCHNPESWKAEREIAFYPDLCIKCGDCLDACPEGAIVMDLQGWIDRGKCNVCGKCADVCPATALRKIGRHYPVDELVERLLSDRVFYETSNGGVTFSGGEPALHMDYLGQAAKELKRHGIHIALQTSGMFDLSEFRHKLLPFTDLIFFDLKLFDAEKHRKYTGCDNRRIMDNFRELVKEGKVKIAARTPLVPDITADSANLAAIAGFVKDSGCMGHVLLPYNSGGKTKRAALGYEQSAGRTNLNEHRGPLQALSFQ
jgi:pyruvate formate lyase activating enzyme